MTGATTIPERGARLPSREERGIVASQLGRVPRGRWCVACHCDDGFPAVIATAPSLDHDEPFPTLFWLTCPWLVEALGAEESRGGAAAWTARLAAEPDLARALLDADASYRAERSSAGGGRDPCARTGIAGARDPLGVKCLHAHAAAALAGIADPVGLASLASTGRTCSDRRCAAASRLPEVAEDARSTATEHPPPSPRW